MRSLLLGVPLALAACAMGIDPVEPAVTPLEVGEVRVAVLTAPEPGPTRRRITAEQLAGMAPELRRTPVVAVPLRGEGGRIGLLDHLLDAMADLDPETLDPAAANLLDLLCAPITALDWRGTRLEGVAVTAEGLGVPLGALLAAALDRPPEAPLLPRAALADALAAGLLGSHPEAVDAQALWLRVDDLLQGLGALSRRYGPRADHPGVFGPVADLPADDAVGLRLALRDNPAPAPGLDLDTMRPASVVSRPSSVAALVDLEHPDWLVLDGLSIGDPVRLPEITLRLTESLEALAGGSGVGGPRGDATAWRAAPWALERVLADAAWRAWSSHRGTAAWPEAAPSLDLTVEAGWLDVTAWAGLPPGTEPGYVWDLVLDLAAARLRDRGVPEGAGSVDISLEDVPLGLSRADLVAAARAGLRARPEALVEIVLSTVGRGHGAPDLYYRVHPTWGDELHFVRPRDVPRDRDNEPVRSVAYPQVGFFADAALSRSAVAGEGRTMTLPIEPGDTVYVGDEHGQVYRVQVGRKPGLRSVRLSVERLR